MVSNPSRNTLVVALFQTNVAQTEFRVSKYLGGGCSRNGVFWYDSCLLVKEVSPSGVKMKCSLL